MKELSTAASKVNQSPKNTLT